MTAKPRVTERQVQRAIVAYLRSIGCVVYVLSQGYRQERGGTRQTPGLPDLYVFPPEHGKPFWWETKAPEGRWSEAQEDFAIRCRVSDTRHGTGDMVDLMRWLRIYHIITATVRADG